MNEHIELFHGLVAFTPWMLVLIFFIISHFLLSWFFNARRTGWKLDFWYLTLFMNFFIFFLMYPFSASEFNVLFLKTDGFLHKINEAFLITILGYLCIWIGKYSFDFLKENTIYYKIIALIKPLERITERNIKNLKTLTWLSVITITFLVILIAVSTYTGTLFNPRKYFQAHDLYRPFFNFTLTLISIVLSYLSCRYIAYKEKMVLYFFLTILALSFFTGLRGIVIYGILNFIIFRIFSNAGRFKFAKLIAQGGFLLFLAIYLAQLREGIYNPFFSAKFFLFQMIYGNHFSDIRDFAYILSHWDENLVYGKTYLAGLISFIPRVFSGFRQEWATSVYTNSIVGFDILEHPGLRAGWFGEPYLNFGYTGVIFIGLMAGYFLRYIDVRLKEAIVQAKDPINAYSVTIYSAFICLFLNSVSFWGFYLFILINLFINLLSRFRLTTR